MKYYKLLTQDMMSYKGMKWEIGVPITIKKEGTSMCSDQVLHCYNHPLLAVFFNPIHANIIDPRLFEIEIDTIVNGDGCKFASKSQTLIKEIPLPEISLEQRIEFSIRVVKLVYKDEKWNLWADKWLSGEDRSGESAFDASSYAYAASYASNAADAAYAASYASNAADAASYAAAYAAYAADAAEAVHAPSSARAVYVAKGQDDANQKMIEIIEEIVHRN